MTIENNFESNTRPRGLCSSTFETRKSLDRVGGWSKGLLFLENFVRPLVDLVWIKKHFQFVCPLPNEIQVIGMVQVTRGGHRVTNNGEKPCIICKKLYVTY